MEWWLALILLIGVLLLLLASGIPVAMGFLLINLVGFILFMGPAAGPKLLTLSIYDSLTKFALVPVPLFILMGEIMFHSGMALRAMDALNNWLGRLPGRLSVLAALSGTLFSALTGSTMANTAMLGSLLMPEMLKRGYSKTMAMGPILGTGGLAMMIPPTALGVLLGSIAQISIGKLLIGAIPAGLLMAVLYFGYIIGRAWLQPHLAPAYDVEPVALRVKMGTFVRDVLPMGFVIFLVIGFMILGIATPTESAALGALGTFALAIYYRVLTWNVVKQSLLGTTKVTVLSFMILAGSTGYSQLLAFTGATAGLVDAVLQLVVPGVVLLILMQLVVLLFGMFMDQISMMLITVPLFMPIVNALGWDPIWFAVILLLNLEIGLTSPPFGMLNFVMKGVAPRGTTMVEIWRSSFPFIVCDVIAMAVIIAFPSFITWLPSLVR